MVNARVAVVGAGPSGLYAAAALVASGAAVDVDVLDRLPAPYGLVRYGVAPDHVKMKSVIRVLGRPFGPGEVRFVGGVRVGEGGIPLAALREHYTAIVHAVGSAVDRRLGIPGEDLPGSIGSGLIVGWYCGHPDHGTAPLLDTPAVAVVGAGNVALDVARVLARTPEELAPTDVPDTVLDALRGGRVRDVHVLIRRGPQHVKFTPVELRQLGDLADAEVVVHDDGLLADPDRPPRHGDRPAGAGEPGGARRVGARRARERSGRGASTCGSCAARCGSSATTAPGHRHRRRAHRPDRGRARPGHGRGGDARRRAGRPGRRLHRPADPRPALRPRDRHRAQRRRARRRRRRAPSCRGSTSPAGSAAARPG